MVRLPRHLWLCWLLASCAAEPPDPRIEADRLRAQAAVGISKIQHALEGPALPSRELGEGVQAVEEATRGLGDLEDDPRWSDAERLALILDQAHAWDAAGHAFSGAPILTGLDPVQAGALRASLKDKAFPAEIAAESSYRRALALALTTQPSLVPEISEALERRGDDAP